MMYAQPRHTPLESIWRVLLLCTLLTLFMAGCSTRSAPPPNAVPAPLPGGAKAMKPSKKEAALLRTARSLIGVPYKWGGDNPKRGFDCSGFIWFVYNVHDINLPRVSWQQYKVGQQLEYGQLRPGDLMFYRINRKGKSLHVGILTDRGTFIHAPSSGKRVMESSLNNIYWRQKYIGARRVLY